MFRSHSSICSHERLTRINDNFVRCLKCGQSLISQKEILRNKSQSDFSKENKLFTINFDRNFSNVLEEIDNENTKPIYEYYTDRMNMNRISINKIPVFNSNPPKYEVVVNGEKNYLTNDIIQKMLIDIKGIKIDKKN